MAFYDWNGNGRSDHFDNYIEMKVSSPSRSSGNVSSGTPGSRLANSSGSGTSTTPGGGTKSTQDSISDLTSTGCIFIFIALVLAGARIIGPLILLLIEETAMFVANSPAAVIAILFIIIAIAALKLFKS